MSIGASWTFKNIASDTSILLSQTKKIKALGKRWKCILYENSVGDKTTKERTMESSKLSLNMWNSSTIQDFPQG